MCNLYNAGAWNTAMGCRNNNGYYAGGQRMCRDCNGNIWMRVTTNHGCCSCCNNCWDNVCGNASNVTNTQNSNGVTGGYGCVTLCGISANTTLQAETTNATTYPMRRCGCNGCGHHRCNGWNYSGC